MVVTHLLFSLCKFVQGGFTIDGHARLEFRVSHHQVMDGNSAPAEAHDADAPGVTLFFQILQDCVDLSRTGRKAT